MTIRYQSAPVGPFIPFSEAARHMEADGFRTEVRGSRLCGVKGERGLGLSLHPGGLVDAGALSVMLGRKLGPDPATVAPETPFVTRENQDIYQTALIRIRDYEEEPGGPPPDDAMREIAREALS